MNISEKITDIIRSKKTQLPTLPVVVDNILRIARDDTTSAKDLAEFVSNDQAVANKVLKLSNSAYYGMMREIDSISRAITIIGFNEVISLTIGMSVISSFRQKRLDEIIPMRDLWIHSIACAFAAKKLAGKMGLPGAEQIFLNGLLHDMGKVLFVLYFPDEYRSVLEEAKRSQAELFITEKQILGLDHSALTGLLMKRWNFPDNLLLPTRFHHNPDKCPPSFYKHASIVMVADYICQKSGLGHSGNPVIPKLGGTRKRLGLDNNDIDASVEDLKGRRNEIEEFLEMME